jgi:hypothetical protein
MNFIHSADFEDADGFYPFDAIAHLTDPKKNILGYKDTIKDARQFPPGSACSGATSAMGSWGNNITRATNTSLSGKDSVYAFKAPLKAVFTDVYNKTRAGTCSDAIPTGVLVYTSDHPTNKSYFGGICSNPGCTYKRSGSGTLGTCE